MSIDLPDRSELRVVVPPEHRWLNVLYAALLRRGLPVRDAVLGDRRLRLSFGDGVQPPLRVVVTPTAPETRAWKETRHFQVSYEGRRQLGADDLAHLRGVLEVLGGLEKKMPPRLPGFAAVVREEASPDDTLRKLFPFATLERSEDEDGGTTEVLVRTLSGCNQKCPFCSGPKHDLPESDIVIACMQAVAELLPGAMVSLTGGEPTLKKSFLDEVRAGLATDGIGSIQVQTNAVSFAEHIDPAALPADPRLSFFVSLHATDPEIYDRCTGTSGMLPEALRGIDRLLAAGHPVTLNAVVSSLNLSHLETLAASLPLGPPDNRPVFHVSALICPATNPDAADFLVRYSELVPVVLRASTIAEGRGLQVTSLLSSTHATVPPCVLPDADTGDRRHQLGSEETESAFGDLSRDWVKAEVCRGCREEHRCLGVPSAYARRFGFAELQTLV